MRAPTTSAGAAAEPRPAASTPTTAAAVAMASLSSRPRRPFLTRVTSLTKAVLRPGRPAPAPSAALTAAFPTAAGAPTKPLDLHVGNPAAIEVPGLLDVECPDQRRVHDGLVSQP